MNHRFYRLKISLIDIEPEIWRRFIVPDSISLEQLHHVVQIVMGWTDSHLHEFMIGKKSYSMFPDRQYKVLDSEKYRLGNLIRRNGRTFNYVYDMGDYWCHEIVLENNQYFSLEQDYEIVCLEGERACPPEDVGGTSGYEELLEVLNDPNHEDYPHLRQRAGVNFDSEEFNLKWINRDLQKFLCWIRKYL